MAVYRDFQTYYMPVRPLIRALDRPMSQLKFSFSRWGDLDPYLIHGSLSQLLKQHLDRFSRFAQLTCVTHRHTEHTTCDICCNWPYLCTVCRRHSLQTHVLRGGSAVVHWTCDLQVTGSIPGRWLSRNIGQLSLASLWGR